MNEAMCQRLEDYLRDSYGAAANQLGKMMEKDLEKGILESMRRYAVLVKKNHTSGYSKLIQNYQCDVLKKLPDKQHFKEEDFQKLVNSLETLMNQINCLVWE